MMEKHAMHEVLVTRISWKNRLLTKTIFFLIIPCILPLLLVCGVVLYYVGEDAQQRKEDSLLASVSEASRTVEHYFAALEGDMKFVASRLDHAHLASPENKLLVIAFATTTHHDIETVWLQDNDGQSSILFSRREMLNKEKPPVLVQPSEPNRTDVTWHATSYDAFGDLIITGSVSIQHPWEDQSFGTLIFTLRSKQLQDIAPTIDVGKYGRAFLVDGEGRLISHSAGPMSVAWHNNMSSQPAMRWLHEANAEDLLPHLVHEQSSLIAYRKILPAHWGVIAQLDKTEIYSTRNRLAFLVVCSFIALGILMIPLVISFSLRLTRPILDLLLTIGKFAAGDLSGQGEVSDRSELGLLTEAFYQMAAQRLKSEKRYREIVDGTDNLITQADKEGRFVFANHVGQKVFGVSGDQLIGMTAFQFVHPDDRERTKRWFADCVERKLEQSTIENRQVSLEGGQVSYFLWNCHFFFDDNGVFSGVNGIAHNITERRIAEEEKRKLEERLLQAQKMESIGTLAGGIAHDFNNILSPILGYAELTLPMVPASGPVADGLKVIHDAAIRAKDLVQQILMFSRQAPHERKPLLPHPIIKESLKLLRSSLPVTIEIREDISTECGMIMGDPTQLQQIVMNLGTNAYHAMREKGGTLGVVLKKIDISEKDAKVIGLEMAPGPYVKIEVSDTGCGMSRETIAKVFEPYFTTKKRGEGTGLGLAIIHGIVKSYGGHITVYSEPGQGTAFHVYLPRVAVEQIVANDYDTEHLPLPVGHERLLVIDDEKAITTMLYDLLAGLGYQVTVCNDSRGALQLFRDKREEFDLIVTDMTMPHMTGLDLTEKIFEIRSDMPVILCTGFSELINKEKAVAMGIRGFLMKPVTVRELAETIRKALAEK